MAGWCFIIPPVIGFDPSPFWNGIIPPNQAAAGRSATNVARCDQPATPAAAPTPWKRLGIQWKWPAKICGETMWKNIKHGFPNTHTHIYIYMYYTYYVIIYIYIYVMCIYIYIYIYCVYIYNVYICILPGQPTMGWNTKLTPLSTQLFWTNATE